MSIDKTDGCQVYLSKDSLKCEIITAKSSEMNICIPPKGSGDYVSLGESVCIEFIYRHVVGMVVDIGPMD